MYSNTQPNVVITIGNFARKNKPGGLNKLDTFTAMMIAEGVDEPESEEQYIAAWQYLIDTGICWKLQGFYGRTASRMIEDGTCHPTS